MIGIYKITNTVNDKAYIGQSVDIEKRWKQHKKMLKDNSHHSIKLQRAWNKYGKDSFEFTVLDEVKKSMLDKCEMDYILQYDSLINGYNMTGVDSIGNFITQSGLTKNRKLELLNEHYSLFLTKVVKYGEDISIIADYYRDKLNNKQYGYREYMKINKLLDAMLNSYYELGDKIVVSYRNKSIRISNHTKEKTIFFYKSDGKKMQVYTGMLLIEQNSEIFDANTLMGGVINNE